MQIAIFNEITTEGVITSIEENSKKYHEGFYADMNNLPERTLVKKSAAEIGDIIKTLKTSRIAITKARTAEVNKEHDAIVSRLEAANKPFTILIDDYNVERKKLLALKKASDEAKAAALQLPIDHEEAIQLNELFDFKKAQVKIEQEARDQKIRDDAIAQARINEERLIKQTEQDAINAKQREIDAVNLAVEQEKQLVETKERDRINEENARLANTAHLAQVNNTILACLIDEGFDEHEAKKFIKLVARKKIPHVKINY